MSCESNDQLAPPELKYPPPRKSDFGKKHFKWSKEEIQSQLPTDILLITANDHEFAACYAQMENVQSSWHDSPGKVYFGQFIGNQNVKVTLMKCPAQGPTAASIAVKNAAEMLYPKVVLFVGICGTMKPAKAKLGDVVISAKLSSYAERKIREDGTVEYRGSKETVSRNMRLLIPHAGDGWESPLKDPSSLQVEVHHDAVMLSGPELVNNPERRQELAEYFRDALGLEMEGAGLCAAAFDLGIEWGVVKGVSDLADGSKSKTEIWQPFSSAMAASVVHYMFKHADVIENWPHYKNIDPRMVKDNAKRPRQEERPNEDEIDAKRPRQEERLNEDEPASNMCDSCDAKNENQLPDDRNKWPIGKIETGCFQEICNDLDLIDHSSGSLLTALGCFTQKEVSAMMIKWAPNGGLGLAKSALDKWGTADRKNNVGELKKIAKKMRRNDVLGIIKKWEKLPVCHGCGIKD